MVYKNINSSKITSSLTSNIKNNLKDNISSNIKEAINKTIEEYNNISSYFLISDKNLSNLDLYIDLFKERLYGFNYIDAEDSISILLPDKDNFNWEGLEILQILSEGLVGEFYELPEDLYYKILDSDISFDIKDELNSSIFFNNYKDFLEYRFKLVKADIVSTINTYLKLEDRLVMFPFSNSAPINLFGNIEDFFEKNIEKLINKTLEDSISNI